MTTQPSTRIAYSIAEAAAAIGRKPDAIHRAIKRGDLAATYIDSRPIILATELDAWLNSAPTERPE